jgi:hypothetical protein
VQNIGIKVKNLSKSIYHTIKTQNLFMYLPLIPLKTFYSNTRHHQINKIYEFYNLTALINKKQTTTFLNFLDFPSTFHLSKSMRITESASEMAQKKRTRSISQYNPIFHKSR